jgi:hypothetical protein
LHEKPGFLSAKGTTKKAEALDFFVYPNFQFVHMTLMCLWHVTEIVFRRYPATKAQTGVLLNSLGASACNAGAVSVQQCWQQAGGERIDFLWGKPASALFGTERPKALCVNVCEIVTIGDGILFKFPEQANGHSHLSQRRCNSQVVTSARVH